MRCAGQRSTSLPRTRTEPLHFSTSPRMARRVVVRPAPLRPSKVTSSPWFTWKSIPCRMCDSPYKACSPATFRYSPGWAGLDWAGLASGLSIAGPHIGFDDLRIGGHLRVASFRQDRAPLQHGNLVAQVGHHPHVVLHHQDGAMGRDLADQVLHAVHVFVPHALRGLVE